MIRSAIGILCVLVVSGCYTQFAMVNRSQENAVPPDSVAADDSTQSRVRDTVRIKDREICYWTRDIWGQPELRCYDSYYGRDWYWYNYYPWWNRSSSYYYGAYNYYGWSERCPAYYYWDYSCGACRYYRGYPGSYRSWWWDSPGNYGSSSTSSAPSQVRRSRSSAVPGTGIRTGVPSGTPKRSGVTSAGGGSESGVSESSGSSPVVTPMRRTRGASVPSASEAAKPAGSGSTTVRELPKQQEQRAVQEQPQPAPQEPSVSPPQNTNRGTPPQSDQNKNSGERKERRNPRSW